jgi:predicted transcriptional regulator
MTDQQSGIELAAELTMAWLGNPNTRAGSEDVLNFLRSAFQAVDGLSAPTAAPISEEKPEEYTPAVTARKSLANPEHIISMIDGRPYKSLRRHLATNGLTPDEYRERYGLKDDYPMVAPAYSDRRRAMAKQIGLGRKPAKAEASETTDTPAL